MTIYILGGGPSGLAVADGLRGKPGQRYVLIERAQQLGGLAQTVTWENVGPHDLGPHKIFSIDKKLVARIEALIPESEWLTREKIGTIFMNGYFLPYPPSPFSLAKVFGLPAFVKMVFGYGLAMLRGIFPVRASKTFEEDLICRVGMPLYEMLFKPIALKLWGNPQTLDVKLSQGRVQTPSLIEVILGLLKIRKHSSFEALDFRYPRGGLNALWCAIEHHGKDSGEFRCGATVSQLSCFGNRIEKIVYRTAEGKDVEITVGEGDFVVSTLPLRSTARLLGTGFDEKISAEVDSVVKLNDLLLVFLHVDAKSLLRESWIFVPDPNIVFHRLSEQESFDPDMIKNGSVVCCELMSNPDRPLADLPDEDLCRKAIQGLERMGYKGFKVLDQRVIRIPQSYPVFSCGYEDGLKNALSKLDGIANFRTIGRQGAFNYIGTLDAMDIGYGFAEWVGSGNAEEWVKERQRTSHYPVLD